MNLPTEITFANGKIDYTYDATGTKVKKVVQPNSGVAQTTDYLYGFQYLNGQLQFFPHAEGYVKPNGTNSYLYVYQYKDHLGNVRLSYADVNGNGTIEPATEILEENNSYPFGLQHQGYNDIANSSRSEEAEAYKFLNKEYEDSFALNVTETDFRHYDSALGRFNVMDVLSELAPNFTPYRYGFNNPVYFNDASGLFESYGAAHRWVTMWGLDDATIRYNRDKRHYEIENDGVSFYQQGEDIIRTMYSWSDSGGLTISYSTISGGAASNNSSRDPGYNPFGFVFTTKDGKDSPVTPSRGPRDAKTIDASIIEFFTDLFGPELTLGYEYDYKRKKSTETINYEGFEIKYPPYLTDRPATIEKVLKDSIIKRGEARNFDGERAKLIDSVRQVRELDRLHREYNIPYEL